MGRPLSRSCGLACLRWEPLLPFGLFGTDGAGAVEPALPRPSGPCASSAKVRFQKRAYEQSGTATASRARTNLDWLKA